MGPLFWPLSFGNSCGMIRVALRAELILPSPCRFRILFIFLFNDGMMPKARTKPMIPSLLFRSPTLKWPPRFETKVPWLRGPSTMGCIYQLRLINLVWLLHIIHVHPLTLSLQIQWLAFIVVTQWKRGFRLRNMCTLCKKSSTSASKISSGTSVGSSSISSSSSTFSPLIYLQRIHNF
jgi:hypothetical protein